jgi:hypothetical protein
MSVLGAASSEPQGLALLVVQIGVDGKRLLEPALGRGEVAPVLGDERQVVEGMSDVQAIAGRLEPRASGLVPRGGARKLAR